MQPKTTGNQGVDYLMRGFALLKRPEIRPFVLIPLLINILLFSGIIYYSLYEFAYWLDQLAAFVPSWLSFINWILYPIFIVLLLLFIAYTFTLIANIIASPFNALLAEKVEEIASGQKPENPTTFLASIPKGLKREAQKWLHLIPLALLVLVISFIPAVNFISPVLWFLFGAWMAVIEYADFAMDNNDINFQHSKRRLMQKRWPSLSFGAATLVGTMIPLVNLLVMPAAVCGATLYWLEQLKELQD